MTGTSRSGTPACSEYSPNPTATIGRSSRMQCAAVITTLVCTSVPEHMLGVSSSSSIETTEGHSQVCAEVPFTIVDGSGASVDKPPGPTKAVSSNNGASIDDLLSQPARGCAQFMAGKPQDHRRNFAQRTRPYPLKAYYWCEPALSANCR